MYRVVKEDVQRLDEGDPTRATVKLHPLFGRFLPAKEKMQQAIH